MRDRKMINLRPATPADLNQLQHWDEQPHVLAAKYSLTAEASDLRVQHWDQQLYVLAADPNDDWHWKEELSRNPDWRELLIAEIDDRPIGFIQIIDPAREETHYWGDIAPDLRAIDIWIGEESDLGKGYGTRMMQLALAQCFADPRVTAVLIDPLANNTRSHRFYERLGFQFVEPRKFGDDDCFVYCLNRSNWQTEVKSYDGSDR
jgi:aminoglycoside 6'-N-acetyltransferase